MKKYLQRFSLVLLSLFLIGTNTPVKAQSTTVSVQILAINDFHGALDSTGSAYAGNEKLGTAGRASVLAAYLDAAEEGFLADNPEGHSIRVQSGDMVGASPAVSGLLQDEPTIKALKAMNFTIGTLGNHEFDEGLEEFNRIIRGIDPTTGQFYDIVDTYDRVDSGQKIVIANLVDEGGSIPFGWTPYEIDTYTDGSGNTVKIGYIGVVTTEIPNLVLKKYHEDYVISDEAEAIAKYSKELQDQGVNAIVILAHCPTTTDGEGNVSGDVADIIDNTLTIYPESSIDVVIAGHNHVYANGTHQGVRVVQSIAQGKAFSNITGEIDVATQDFVETPDATVTPTLVDGDKLPLNGLAINQNVQDIVDEANTIIAPIASAAISEADLSVVEDNMISRTVNRDKESPVGNLVTDGQLASAQKTYPNVDFAMTNNGGIRADLSVNPDGTITWGAAQAVQPFGNILQVVEMSGQQIVDALNQQYDGGEKYFLQISGLTYTYTDTTNPDLAFEVKDVFKRDGTPLDLTKTYQVVINDFLFGGGDEFTAFTGATLVGAIDPDTETFIQYLKDLSAAGVKVSAKTENRKQYVSSVDKSLLEDLVSEAEEIDINQYTLESVGAFNTALEDAKAVLENTVATEEEVNDAYQNLKTAIENLVEVDEQFTLIDAVTGVIVNGTTEAFNGTPKLVVKKVEYNIDGHTTVAYDISFEVDGKAVQPNEAIEVILPLGEFDAKQVKLYHLTDNEAEIYKIDKVEDKGVFFTSDSFSVYVLAQAKIPNTGVDSTSLKVAGAFVVTGSLCLIFVEIKRRRKES